MAQPWPSLPCPRSQHRRWSPPSTDPASGLRRTGNWTSGPRHPPRLRLRLGRKEGEDLHFYCRLKAVTFCSAYI